MAAKGIPKAQTLPGVLPRLRVKRALASATSVGTEYGVRRWRRRVWGNIYFMEPEVSTSTACGARLDMPDVVANLLTARNRVAVFALRDRWLDVGRPDDYERARVGQVAIDDEPGTLASPI
jgi:hypothetical protein